MNRKDIQLLYAFNSWANARVLDSCAALSEEQLTREMGNSFRSVRDTLAHIMAAEQIWVMRWKGHSPRSLWDGSQFPTFDAVRTRWAEVEREITEFVRDVPEERLNEVITYTNTKGEEWSYTLGHMMQHVVNHSTYHRGQVTTMLRQLGARPVMTDFLAYFDETPEG